MLDQLSGLNDKNIDTAEVELLLGLPDEVLIKNIYPDARIVDIPEAGHWLHAEQPEKFMQAVMLCC